MTHNDVERQVNYQRQQLAKIDTNMKPQSSSHDFTGTTQSHTYGTTKSENIANTANKIQREKHFMDLLYKSIMDAISNNISRETNKQRPSQNKPIQAKQKIANTVHEKPANPERSSSINQFIYSYITGQYLAQLEYSGGRRIVEIYCHGINEAGHEAIRVYQTSGFSRSGEPSGYKTFLVNKIKNINPLDNERFIKRPDYKINDLDFTKIFCQIT